MAFLPNETVLLDHVRKVQFVKNLEDGLAVVAMGGDTFIVEQVLLSSAE